MWKQLIVGVILLAGCATRTPNIDEALTAGIFLDLNARSTLPAGVTLRPIYQKGIETTKTAEHFRSYLYNDVARFCTIGYGHLVKRSPCDGTEPSSFLRGISEANATTILVDDMARAQVAVILAVNVELTDGQFAALCDFVFNVGPTNFKNSTLLKLVNLRQFDGVPTQLRRWIIADGIRVRGLVNRRESEITLFFDGSLTPRSAQPAGEDRSRIDIRSGLPAT